MQSSLMHIKGGGISKDARERIQEKPQKDPFCHRNLHLILTFVLKTSDPHLRTQNFPLPSLLMNDNSSPRSAIYIR